VKIQTFSIVAGSAACNAKCPFCVSKMSPSNGVSLREPHINIRNFRKACRLAKQCGVTTVMITSKGEPTLYPNQITKYLEALKEHAFPLIELQTNGILMSEDHKQYRRYLESWYAKELNTIAVSVVHYDAIRNREVYLPHKESYPDLPDFISYLHKRGFSVRLSCVLLDGYIDGPESLEKMIKFAKQHKVEQLSVRPVNKTDNISAPVWHALRPVQRRSIREYLKKVGTPLMNLVHGAMVYDVKGQNVCLTNSLTIDPASEDLRQLIYFPDGHLRYDWQYEGAVIL